MNHHIVIAFLCAGATAFAAPFAGFENKGLVAAGRMPSNLLDKFGNGATDTLGGFSAMAIDPASLRHEKNRISGILHGLPDRGFGDGATDYHPRIQTYSFSITPHQDRGPAGHNQIQFTNVSTLLLTDGAGATFTGYDAADTNEVSRPRSAKNSPGSGHWSIDPEGLVRLEDGSWWISDEYGPGIFRFEKSGKLIQTFLPPAALLPYSDLPSGRLNFTATALPASGRRNNRGFEGLTLTPDGKRLVAVLQSPAVQDEGAGNAARNTRVVQFDAVPESPTYGRVVGEYIYQLTLNGSPDHKRHTVVSEVVALTSTTFLALERDSLGRGALTNTPPIYKRVVLFSTEGATDMAGSAYDLRKSAPGQLSFPAGSLPTEIIPVKRQDFVDLLDASQLARFGLNATHDPELDPDAVPEKWEALALLPLRDAAFPNDHLLLVGCDNDFKAPLVYHNGSIVGTNKINIDIFLLAYRVTIPR